MVLGDSWEKLSDAGLSESIFYLYFGIFDSRKPEILWVESALDHIEKLLIRFVYFLGIRGSKDDEKDIINKHSKDRITILYVLCSNPLLDRQFLVQNLVT